MSGAGDHRARQRRSLALVAAGCGVAYVASKIHFALTSRLGIFGGPTVSGAEVEAFGTPADIARAQWANAAAGAMLLGLTLLALRPRPAGRGRWLLGAPLAVLGAALVGFGLFMIIRGAVARVGGYPFGAFTVVWGCLELALARAWLTRTGTAG